MEKNKRDNGISNLCISKKRFFSKDDSEIFKKEKEFCDVEFFKK